MTQLGRLSQERIAHAATVIDPVFLDSPQFLAEPIGRALDCRLLVKIENFGQGMAWSARKRGLSLTVFTAVSANPLKVERMRALGADVRLVGRDVEAAHEAAKRFAADTGARLVEDGRDREIAEGAGTIGIELSRWPEPFDAIVVPPGDGALLAGIARWVKAHHPATEMIGVCASGAPAMERSWRAGRVEELDTVDTIADGIAVKSPFPEALEDITAVTDDVLLVDDDAIVQAIRRAYGDLGIVLEPAGAAGLAAVMAHRARFRGQLVATILSGGNATADQLREWLA